MHWAAIGVTFEQSVNDFFRSIVEIFEAQMNEAITEIG